MINVAENIRSISPYVPGKPIEELERELGIHDVLKLASNENPLGPSPVALERVKSVLPRVHLYPDAAAHELRTKLANRLDDQASSGECPAILRPGGDERGLGVMEEVDVARLASPREELVEGPAPGHVALAGSLALVGYEPADAPLEGRESHFLSLPAR